MIYIKNEIQDNYNLKIDKIYKNENESYFFVNDKKIYIKSVGESNEKEIDELIKLTNDLYSKNKPTETFLINRQGKHTIKHKNRKMALLMANKAENTVLNYNDIIAGTIEIKDHTIKNYDIYNEWKKIIDNFEENIVKYNKEFQLIMKYANYYIGLAENAIQLLGETKATKETDKYLGRLIKENKYNYKNYVDPFAYIKTLKLYDVANYFKYKLYIDEIDYEELESAKKNLEDEDDKKIFLSIVVFPTEAFERMNKILEEKMDEKAIVENVKRIKKTEQFILYIQNRVINKKYIKLLVED